MTIGVYLALFGAAIAAGLACCGSAIGVGTAGQAAAGVTAEDPDKFGKAIVLELLPATQGLYGFIIAFLVIFRTGLIGGEIAALSTAQGFAVLASCIPIGLVGLISGIYQGKAAASAISMYAKRSELFGKGVMITIMVETFAIFGLLISFLGVWFAF